MSDIISNGTRGSIVWQWLASRSVRCGSDTANFNVRFVSSSVGYANLYNSNGSSNSYDDQVRPIVTLSSEIQLSGNSIDGWTIN